MLLWAFAFQLEEQGYYYELEGNWVNISCICESVCGLIALKTVRKDRHSMNHFATLLLSFRATSYCTFVKSCVSQVDIHWWDFYPKFGGASVLNC